MERTIKTKLYVMLIVLACMLALCLCACSGSGESGENGASGKSAYEVWLDEGHTGSQADFLDWLKGDDGKNGNDGIDGQSAYQIFTQLYPYYQETEEQWLISLVNGKLQIHEIRFKSEVADDIVKYVVGGYSFTDIPEVPKKEGQTSAAWDVTDFSSITQNTEVTAVYDMRKYVTFHNEYTDDEDIVKTVEYGEALTDIPQITEKVGNDGKWSITKFGKIIADTRVEAVYQTQGLKYTLINQESQYSVSQDDISVQTKELFIPSTYNGKPVTVIDTLAFYSCFMFTTVHIPDSIVEIRESAFSGCSSLTSIVIPNSVTSIGNSAFSDCSSLTRIEIPNSITSISVGVFKDCVKLMSIVIPSSVKYIQDSAFDGCIKLITVYYNGARSEFSEIVIIASNNESFSDAIVYFYSETAPTDDGYYWHYDTDGKPSVVWKE